MMPNARKYRDPGLQKQPDEQARLKVIQGPDAGAIYVVSGQQAVIGRGDDTDVVLTDLKASRRHLELLAAPGGWVVRDLASANGITVNGHAVRSATVRNGDTVQLGETLFEFFSGDAPTALIQAPARTAAQVYAEQAAFEAQRARVRALAGVKTPGAPADLVRPSAKPATAGAGGLLKNKRVLMYGALGVAAYFFLFDEPAQQQRTKQGAQPKRDLAAYIAPSEAGIPNARSADVFFRDGFREYRAKNYLRARQQFETALQVHPGHPLARLYLDNSNKAIEDMVKYHLDHGKKALAFGRHRQAKSHFETVLRSLHRDQTNSAYLEARDQLEKTQKLMKGEG